MVNSFSRKLAYSFVIFGIFILITLGVNAYGTNNPPVMGHSLGELAINANCGSGQILKAIGTGGYTCVNAGQVNISTGLTACAGANQSIKTINPITGAVTCETDDVGSGGGLSGTGSANFLTLFTGASSVASSVVYQDPVEWRIGIGTQSFADSTERLHVAYSGDTKAVVESTGGNHAGVRIKSGADSWTSSVESGTKRFRIYQETGAGAGEKITILPGGNVGIGTTTPGRRLDVFGDIEMDSGVFYWGSSANGWSYMFNNPGIQLSSVNDYTDFWAGGRGYGGVSVGSITTIAGTDPSPYDTGEIKVGGAIRPTVAGGDVIIQLG